MDEGAFGNDGWYCQGNPIILLIEVYSRWHHYCPRANQGLKFGVPNENLPPVIETERLRLRPHQTKDFADCVAMWSDPAITRYTIGNPSPSSLVHLNQSAPYKSEPHSSPPRAKAPSAVTRRNVTRASFGSGENRRTAEILPRICNRHAPNLGNRFPHDVAMTGCR
jgi:hypothetical protein